MFLKGLIDLGWISGESFPDYYKEMPKAYWNWLTRCNSQYLSFNPEDGYSANWDGSNRSEIRKELIKKLQSDSLDLIIAMGTWAGQDLANNEHSVPVLVMSTSNPIEAGIIKSAGNSGFTHVTARVDPDRYLRQVRMFHRIVGFNTLGVAFENSPDGRIYSAIDEVEKAAGERDFKPVYCEVQDTISDTEKSDNSCMACYKKLSRSVDAVYVTALTCVDRNPAVISALFREAGIPTFSLNGSKFVKDGLLMSISSDSGYKAIGSYYAQKFGEILNGAKPVDLKQKFEDPLDIAVNLKTAKAIGFEFPKSILTIAAEIYE
jgi:ABC-type uncharacterized transport system substrate-binding protein